MNDKPEIKPKGITPLKHICMTIGELPSSYLETMTYYEMLLWFTKFLQERMIPALDNNALAVEELQQLFIELQSYVNNYFDNLDVQDEINNKLDQMLEDGVLEQIIEQFLISSAVWCFDNVSNMVQASNLTNGSYAKTLGYYTKNDKGSALYKIRTLTNEDVIDEKFIIALSDETLIAELIYTDDLNIMQLGYTDDIGELLTAYNKGINTLLIPDGNYHIKSGTYSNINLKGYKNSNLIIDDVITFNKLSLENINISAENITQMFLPNGTNVEVYVKDINVNSEVDYFIYSPSENIGSVTFNNIIIKNSNFENLGVSAFRLIGQGNIIKMYNNKFKNIGTSESTRTSGIQAGVLSNDDLTSYFNEAWIENNDFYNLTSANSTGSDTSECQAIKIRCLESFINNNKIEKINGTGEDHEGIYVKGEKATITNNILIDCGEGDGAITCKPVTTLICSNNIIDTTGTGLLLRSVQGIIENNNVNVKNSNSSTYRLGRFGDNESTNLVIQNNYFSTSDNTSSAIAFDYVGCTLKNNIINAKNVRRLFTFSNSLSGKLKIIDNIINLDTCELYRVDSISSNLEVLFSNNKFNLKSCASITEYASGTNSINLLFYNNEFNLSDNNSSDYLFRDDNKNANSNTEFINNIFNLYSPIDTLILLNGALFKFIDNKIVNNSIVYLARIGTDKTLIDIENNILPSTNVIRFTSTINVTNFKFINNFIFENTNIFTTNTATITNGYLINNTFKGGTITSNISATTLKNYGNGSYN